MHEYQSTPGPETVEVDFENNAARLLQAIESSPPADAPRIWVGSIEDYLDAAPHGCWISAARPPEDLAADVEAMLTRSPAAAQRGTPSRWGIFAAEGFGRYQPSPLSSLADVAGRARAIQRESRAFAAWSSLDEGNAAHAERFGQISWGRFDSFSDWLNLRVEQLNWHRKIDAVLPEDLRPFVVIDIDALGHDLLASGEVSVVADQPGSVWVFENKNKRYKPNTSSAIAARTGKPSLDGPVVK